MHFPTLQEQKPALTSEYTAEFAVPKGTERISKAV